MNPRSHDRYVGIEETIARLRTNGSKARDARGLHATPFLKSLVELALWKRSGVGSWPRGVRGERPG